MTRTATGNQAKDVDLRGLLRRLDRRERERALALSRELHDDPLQLLSAAIMRIALVRAAETPDPGSQLDEVESLVRRALEQVRQVSRRLGLVSAGRHGLPVALENLAACQAERYEMTVRTEIAPAPAPAIGELADEVLETVNALLVRAAGSRERGSLWLRYGRDEDGDLEIVLEATGFDPRWETELLDECRERLRPYDVRLEAESSGPDRRGVRIMVPRSLTVGA